MVSFPIVQEKIFDKMKKYVRVFVIVTLQGEVKIFLKEPNNP